MINLKGLKQFVMAEHFKMEGLYLLPDLLQPQDCMVKVDLKDAYLQIPIHPDYQNLLTFQWEGKTYMFQCLPFGPRVFTKLLKPVVGFLRQNGCRLIMYLDDMLMLHQDRDQLQHMTQLTCQLLKSLGLMVNLKILTDANSRARISRFPSVLGNNKTHNSPREIEEDPTGCQASARSRICVSEGNSKVCGQSYCNHKSHPTGHIALQSSSTIDELCPSPELHLGGNI